LAAFFCAFMMLRISTSGLEKKFHTLMKKHKQGKTAPYGKVSGPYGKPYGGTSGDCPPGAPQVRCFSDPCSYKTCPANPTADCTANYCGGCNAIFTDKHGHRVKCYACPPDQPEVQCFADPCSITTCEAYPDANCTANYCGGCNAIFTDENGQVLDCSGTSSSHQYGSPLVCTEEAFECPDGSFVGRDPNNHCHFRPCPDSSSSNGNGIVCALDVRSCPDGSSVSRDPNRGCAFAPCPTSSYNQGKGHY